MKSYLHCLVVIVFISFSSCNNNESPMLPQSLTNAITHFYAENENEQVLEQLNQLSANELSNVEIATLKQIFTAAALCEMSKLDSASTIIKAINPKNKTGEFKFWHNSIMGLVLFREDKLSEAYQQLINTTTSNFTDKRALALNERLLARIAFSLSDQEKGFDWILQSTTHFEQAGLIKNTGVNNKIMGRQYMNAGNYAEALKYFKSAESIFKKHNDKVELFYVYINLIDYYLTINELDKARNYAIECQTQCSINADNQMKAILFNNLGEIEMKLQNYDVAIRYLEATLQLKNDYSSNFIRRINAHIKLSKIYSQMGKLSESMQHARKAYDLLPRMGYNLLKYNVFSELANAHKINKLDKLSFTYLDSANIYLDSAYHSVSKTTKAFYDTKADLVNTTFKMERMKENERKTRSIYLTLISALGILILFVLVVAHLLRSKNILLKALVNKNLEIIKDERKLHASVKQVAETTKCTRKSNGSEKEEFIYNQLITWIETGRQYSRKDLTVEIIAKELNTNRDYLSHAINVRNVRFNDLINRYRIQEAIQIMSAPSHKCNKYSLSVIGNEVGFNTNSVFFDAFRKHTGMSPAQFRTTVCSNEKTETEPLSNELNQDEIL